MRCHRRLLKSNVKPKAKTREFVEYFPFLDWESDILGGFELPLIHDHQPFRFVHSAR